MSEPEKPGRLVSPCPCHGSSPLQPGYAEGGAKKKRCEREVWYEAMGLPPRNCIADDRMLCQVCLETVMPKEVVRVREVLLPRKKRNGKKKARS